MRHALPSRVLPDLTRHLILSRQQGRNGSRQVIPVWDCGAKHLYLNKLIIPRNRIESQFKMKCDLYKAFIRKEGHIPSHLNSKLHDWMRRAQTSYPSFTDFRRRYFDDLLKYIRSLGLGEQFHPNCQGIFLLFRFFITFAVVSKFMAMNDFKHVSFETVSDAALS